MYTPYGERGAETLQRLINGAETLKLLSFVRRFGFVRLGRPGNYANKYRTSMCCHC